MITGFLTAARINSCATAANLVDKQRKYMFPNVKKGRFAPIGCNHQCKAKMLFFL